MKPRLVASQGSNTSKETDNTDAMARSVSQLIDDWNAVEKLMSAYISGQSNSNGIKESTKSIFDEEAELDRLTDKQQKLLETIVQTACQSEADVYAKLKLWESCVVGDDANTWMQSTDHLVLSALRDLGRLSEADDVQLSKSSRKL